MSVETHVANSDSQGTSAAAGWYSDPGRGDQRYWDGSRWTEFVHPAHPPTPQAVGGGYGQAAVFATRNSKATWSLVLGILGLIVIPIVFSILAIVFGVSARSEIDRVPQMEGRSNATAGIVLGIVGLAAWALILLAATGGA